MFHVLIAFCLGLGLLAGRLLWLQVWGASPRGAAAADATLMSVRQRAQGVTLDPGRGHIVDRRSASLTGQTVNGLLMLPGGADRMTDAERRSLARLLNVPPMRLLDEWRGVDRPSWWNPDAGVGRTEPLALTPEQASAIRDMRIPGATVASAVVRYPERRIAAHLVGFVAEQPERMTTMYGKRLTDGHLRLSTPIGASGLELAFDRLLQGVGETRIVSYIDGQGKPLDGLGVQTVGASNPYYPLRLISTVDAAAQRAVEAAADAAGLKVGAVVVLDVASSDIVAMASRPAYETDRLSPEGQEWANRAIRAVAPGSIMKSFVAAAALEEGVVGPDEMFDCDGTYPHYGLTCWKEGGHGRLTFAEALAESCNIVFAEVGERLSGETLQRYGAALGVIGPVGWEGVSAVDGEPLSQLPEEQPGRLFAGPPEAADGGVLAQTAIGQRDARWTPLAAANWMATIARGGAPSSPRAASELQYADGHAAERYDAHRLPGGDDAISPATTRALRGMLEGVVEFGTGASLRTAVWPLAGKSGTAEATVGGRDVVHQWFVGYGPTDKPTYAVAVLAESRPVGSSNRATAVFKAVMDALAELPE
jgi:cell division protein FtsI/penicillin-binding protein 2